MRERNCSVVDLNFSEDASVLFLERNTTASKVLQDLIKFVPLEIAKRVSSPNECKRFLDLNRCESSQPDDVLRQDVVRFLLNTNWIERALPNEFGGDCRFHQVADIGCD